MSDDSRQSMVPPTTDTGGPPVHGRLLDRQTRCAHYHGDHDIVAVKFKCCGRYYGCYFCHEELEDHPPARWGPEEFGKRAVRCGVCGEELTIQDYLSSGFSCPSCRSSFNPGCARHYHLYFVLDPSPA